jgi:hypothetical protein
MSTKQRKEKTMNLWNHDEPISSYDSEFKLPLWIDQEITPSTVAAILQGGCESGAYMLAVTYTDADHIMSSYGNLVIDYIEESLGEIPKPNDVVSWSGLAVFYLSTAVELWASEIEQKLIELLPEEENNA